MKIGVAKSNEVISTLNGLIETCRDGQKGFAEAAENITHPDIQEYCLEQSRSRARFVGELQQEVQGLGGDPENTGSTAGAMHRAWINLKSTLGGGDHMIVAACEDGEDSAIREYEKALKNDLPNNVRETLESQYQSIKASHNRVRLMRDSLAT